MFVGSGFDLFGFAGWCGISVCCFGFGFWLGLTYCVGHLGVYLVVAGELRFGILLRGWYNTGILTCCV